MEKTEQVCGKCGAALQFRRWSRRYPRGGRWREALADCPAGCGTWAIRYFDGAPTCEPYQMRGRGEKNRRGSWRLSFTRVDEICAVWGSVQSFLDGAAVYVAAAKV